MATGAEVHLLLDAHEQLQKKGIASRVVNIPSWELFEAQPKEYREQVLPSSIRARFAVEAGSPLGWERYTGIDGEILAMDRFGASAPAKVLFEAFGFTAEQVVKRVEKLLAVSF